MLNRYTASEGGLAVLEKSDQSTMSDTMKQVIVGLNALERRIGMDGEAVRIQLNSISNCLHNYEPRLEMVETDAKDHHRRICCFEETLASLSERWGVASSSAKFHLSSLDVTHLGMMKVLTLPLEMMSP